MDRKTESDVDEDIFVNPDFNIRLTNSNGDIYANEDNPGINQPVCHKRTTTSGSSSKEARCYKLAVLSITLLCTLLLVVVVVVVRLSENINSLTIERDQLQTSYNNLTKETDQLQTSYNNLTKETDQLQTSYNNLTKEKDQLQTSYNSLTKETDQLQTSYNNLDKEKDEFQSEREGLKKKLLELEKDIRQSGWVAFRSSLYYISTQKKNWRQSRDDCAQRGAHLVIITTKEEQDFVKSLKYDEKVWIGLNDVDKEGVWKWVDGSALNIPFWNNGEPAGKRNENCVVTGYNSDPSRNWMDFPCDWSFLWICEKKF